MSNTTAGTSNAISTNSDPLWETLRARARIVSSEEPSLAPLLDEFVLIHPTFEKALALRLSAKLVYHSERGGHLHDMFSEAYESDKSICQNVRRDLEAIMERDPACDSVLTPFLWFKGFQALTCHRVAHWLWNNNRQHFARYLQSMVSEVFAVDIHPAARLGGGILLDHATGFVAGETAVIEDNVSILHDVTLGGTGKEKGDRHPKVRRGVLIGAGAKILGNIEIGECSKIGAGSVVLQSVPPHSTAAGVPAVIIGEAREESPSLTMDHCI
ncbi:MAG: serine O-acetyltransferase [Puniceicoccales bacterium]|jgi:serine O-acetyltransferase|nr:serine O-acetyltransferase [Puniceicoccales bacterium]